MIQYTFVNNRDEDVFRGQCGGYITSKKPVPHNRVTAEKSAEAVQFEVVPEARNVTRL
jgi:hypothetical protein